MQPFLFKTNKVLYEGDLDHHHWRLKVGKNFELHASAHKLEIMETSLSNALYCRNKLAYN